LAASDKKGRTEQPTPKRKREARKKGQIPRSSELLAWIAIMAASFLFQFTVANGLHMWQGLMAKESTAISTADVGTDLKLLGTGLSGAFGVAAPLVLGLMLIGVIGNFAQVGLTFKRMKPSFSRLNPKNGIKRLVSAAGAWETVKQIGKVSLIGLIAWRSISSVLPALVSGGLRPPTEVARVVATRALTLVRTVAFAGLIIALVDYYLQRRRMKKAQMMTKQEVKDEARMSEGSPEIKGAIRRRQRKLSRLRMIAAVASADAVVVNPTHYAVALKYEPGQGAPRVVAKGIDLVAIRIRQEAADRAVPVVEDRPLARALFAACNIDQEIPADLYEAVAKLLTFIYSLKATGRALRLDGGAHRPPTPLLAEPG